MFLMLYCLYFIWVEGKAIWVDENDNWILPRNEVSGNKVCCWLLYIQYQNLSLFIMLYTYIFELLSRMLLFNNIFLLI